MSAVSTTGLAPLLLSACSFGSRESSYADAVQSTWRRDPNEATGATSGRPLFEELVRCATLAPSSHNTQCWKFAIQPQSISIFPDLSRRCPAVDPDDHHLFVSLGCAAENMVQAALAHGLQADVTFDAADSDALKVQLEPTKAISTDLYAAMFDRQCTRADFDGRPLSVDELKSLERAGIGNGVQMLILSDKTATEKMLEYIVDANT